MVYDDFHKPGGYRPADYDAKWTTFMAGEMAIEDTRRFANRTLAISATPFRTGQDAGQGITATFANVVVSVDDR
jgi:hypothetical protein